MKKSILFLLALFSVTMTIQAAYYYRGDKNSWGNGIQLTQSADGYYYYYEATAGAHNFKILNNATSWSATQWNENHILSLYNGTDVAVTKAGSDQNIKCSATTKHYILFYPKGTKLNGSTNDYICASTTLPNGFGAMYLKHPWNGGDWVYQNTTNNGDGTFSFVGKYGGNGVNWCVQQNGTGEKWIASPTLVGSPVTGDDCTFTFNGADQTITITKKVNKTIGDITITMNCTQQPKIFFWEVEGKTCAAWPGEDMVAAGANTYTYTFEDVDVDLGVNYKINLKEVNENEWNTGDLHTTTDVTHDVSDLNIPKIVVLGVNGDWGSTNTLTELSNDYLTVSKTISVEEVKTHDIKMHVGDNQYQGGNVVDITRANPSSEKFDKEYSYDNGKFTADIAGDYVFTYTYKTHTLTVTYPELPTPEYKDITVTVYAKEVPNIWWWNGGDQCLSTEELINPSTGNTYEWDEAPAMEKVAGEDNWYTKTFENVDITKGGIKFKLQSTDHSTSTTNEVVTTEDKCYDARVITAITETPCGVLPEGEIAKLTYYVEVPEGTNDCYIAGEMNGWTLTQMNKVDDRHYTITIEGATTAHTYKYASGPDSDWKYVEVKEDGSDVSNRTYNANDVVEKWKAVYDPSAPTYDYYIVGSFNGDDPKKAENGMTLDGTVYKATVTLAVGDNTLKVTKGSWDPTWGYNELGAAYEEVSDAGAYNNIKITLAAEKSITVIFDATAGKITFDGLTPVTVTPVTAYTVTVPKGTEKCYIVGAFAESEWSTFIEMTRVGTEDKFTIEVGEGKAIASATSETEYKYSASQSWDNQEVKDASDNSIDNRTWSANDVVVKWKGIALVPGKLTYTVTVPAGTKQCYIAGDMNGWTAQSMTPGGANKFTISFDNVTIFTGYKYTCKDGDDTWAYVEKKNGNGSVDNRTYNANDVVERWNRIDISDGENAAIIGSHEGKGVVEVQVNRQFEAGKLYTLSLPFTMSEKSNIENIFGDGTIVYEFSKLEKDDEDLVLYFNDAITTIEAGKPYLIQPGQDVDGFRYENVDVDDTNKSVTNSVDGTTVTMESVLSVAANAMTNGKYWLASDNILYKTNTSLLSLRAVFDIQSTKANIRARVAFGENVETGVDNIVTTDAPVKVIKNGQLIIIRDGVKYNIQGQKL